MDYCYYDYPTTIKNKKLNGYGDITPEPIPVPGGVFVPRLTKPEYGNKYYNITSSGGYATSIVGKPTQAGLTALSN